VDESLIFLGRLHVVVVHLPIGILIALGLIELMAWWRSSDAPPATRSLALMGSLSAVVTAALGVLLSYNGNYDPTLLFRHQWLGIAVAVSSVVAFGLKARRGSVRVYRKVLALSLVLLVLGAHQGGSLTHGSGFLFAGASKVDSVDASPAALVLETHCYECHGATKQESGLRLDERAAILAGGDSGEPAVVAGRAIASELVRRITLPRADEDAMPPDGKPRLRADEMLLLIDWINAGASFEPAYAIEAAPDDAIEELVAAGIDIARLSESDPRLSVNLQFAADETITEPLLLLAPVASQIAWLNVKARSLSEAEWVELARFDNLTRLHLEQTNVEDRHLESLRNASQLEYLNLYGTNVGDDGLAFVSELPKLADVYVWQTRVTDDGVAAWILANPDIRIHRGVAASP
jgi:uncharacterized membrane protein